MRFVVTLTCRAQTSSSADRKSTRLNPSHGYISYAVFCLKKKNKVSHDRLEQDLVSLQTHNALHCTCSSAASPITRYSAQPTSLTASTPATLTATPPCYRT